MNLRRTATNDQSAPRLEYTTPGSAALPLPPRDAIGKGKKEGTVGCNTASNRGIVHDSSVSTDTHLDLTGHDKIRKSPLKISKIGGECQPSNAKDTHKISPKTISDHKQTLFRKDITSYSQGLPAKESSDDSHHEVIAKDPVKECGATARKENSNTARKFFNSLRSKKSMANLSKTTDVITVPNDPGLFFSSPSNDLLYKESNTNVMDNSMGNMPSPFDSSPVAVNLVAQPTESVIHRTAPDSLTFNPANSLPITNLMWKPPHSLGTADTEIERPKRPIRNTARGKADLSLPDEATDYDDDSSEEHYMSPEAALGYSSTLPPKSEEVELEFANDNSAVRQLTKLHLQNDYELGSTRNLIPSHEQTALGMGSATCSDAGNDSGNGATDPIVVETTSGSSACSTDAARKMLEMSTAIDHLHAAAEAADVNTADQRGRSPGTATEEQKMNYSAGMVIPPPLSCFDHCFSHVCGHLGRSGLSSWRPRDGSTSSAVEEDQLYHIHGNYKPT